MIKTWDSEDLDINYVLEDGITDQRFQSSIGDEIYLAVEKIFEI